MRFVSRLPKRPSFTRCVTGPKLPSAWQKTYEATNTKELLGAYAEWAPTYDEDSIKTFGYAAPKAAAKALARHLNGPGRQSGEAKILDLGAGTGLVGEFLAREQGLTAVTGVDLSAEMLAVAEAKACYDSLICGDLTNRELFDADASFDALVCVGTLTPNHIVEGDTLRMWYEWLKPKGIAVLSVRTDFWQGERDNPLGVPVACAALEDEGKWKLVEVTAELPYTVNVDPGITFTVRTYRST